MEVIIAIVCALSVIGLIVWAAYCSMLKDEIVDLKDKLEYQADKHKFLMEQNGKVAVIKMWDKTGKEYTSKIFKAQAYRSWNNPKSFYSAKDVANNYYYERRDSIELDSGDMLCKHKIHTWRVEEVGGNVPCSLKKLLNSAEPQTN